MKSIVVFYFYISWSSANDRWPWTWSSMCPQNAKCKCLITLNEIKYRLDAVSDLAVQVNRTFQDISLTIEPDMQIQFRNLIDKVWLKHGFTNRCVVVLNLPCNAVQMVNHIFIKRNANEWKLIECKKNTPLACSSAIPKRNYFKSVHRNNNADLHS